MDDEHVFSRSLDKVWLEASNQFPVLLLTGSRQVGKTTLLQHLCEKQRKYVSLDDPTTRSLAREDPAFFLKRHDPPLLIDEIQYAPDLLPYIKMMVDSSKKTGQFWLTGSQQFLMMKGISETLAGRVAILNLLGFSGRERYGSCLEVPSFLPVKDIQKSRQPYKDKPGLKDIFRDIWLGSFPALIAGPAKNKALYYSSYLQTYLQRDIKDLTKVGDELSFLKFIRACAARTGQILNLSDLANDVDISIPTAKSWLSILQASFQVYLLQPYHSNVTKRLIKTPKLYFLDTGLCSYLTEWSSPETLEAGAMSGAVFETYVLSEILKSYWHSGLQPALYYYRDKDMKEIDFLIERNQKLYPLEVKKASMPKREWIKHFSVLKKLKREVAHGAVLCMIDAAFPIDDNNDALPISMI